MTLPNIHRILSFQYNIKVMNAIFLLFFLISLHNPVYSLHLKHILIQTSPISRAEKPYVPSDYYVGRHSLRLLSNNILGYHITTWLIFLTNDKVKIFKWLRKLSKHQNTMTTSGDIVSMIFLLFNCFAELHTCKILLSTQQMYIS